MMLAQHTLTMLGEDARSIDAMLAEARAGHYARVRAFFHSFDDIDLDRPDRHHLRSVEILSNYHAVGQSIGSLRNLERTRVVALRRDGESSEDPELDTTILAGDVLVIKGDPDNIQATEIEIMAGL